MNPLAQRHPDLTCFRWVIEADPPDYRTAEHIVTHNCLAALAAVRAAVRIESAYVSKHVTERAVWLTVFASLCDSSKVLNAINPTLTGLQSTPVIIADLGREELLQAHCDRFRLALDLVTSFALDVHVLPGLGDHQRALISVGAAGRTSRAALESYLKSRSSTFKGLSDPQQFWSVLGCNCLTGQTTDALHWLYNIILGFDWEWGLGEAAIRARLGL